MKKEINKIEFFGVTLILIFLILIFIYCLKENVMENYKQHSWTYNTNLIKVSTRNNQDIEVEISSPNCNFNKQRLFIKSILKEDIQSDDFIRRINKMIACNE